jgi:hypothetical protein
LAGSPRSRQWSLFPHSGRRNWNNAPTELRSAYRAEIGATTVQSERRRASSDFAFRRGDRLKQESRLHKTGNNQVGSGNAARWKAFDNL